MASRKDPNSWIGAWPSRRPKRSDWPSANVSLKVFKTVPLDKPEVVGQGFFKNLRLANRFLFIWVSQTVHLAEEGSVRLAFETVPLVKSEQVIVSEWGPIVSTAGRGIRNFQTVQVWVCRGFPDRLVKYDRLCQSVWNCPTCGILAGGSRCSKDFGIGACKSGHGKLNVLSNQRFKVPKTIRLAKSEIVRRGV